MASRRVFDPSASPSNPDTLPTPNDPSGPCPRCGRISNFKVEDREMVLRQMWRQHYMGYVQERADVLTCNGCQESTVVITERFGVDELGMTHVYPPPGAGALDRQVNKKVASAYDEGMRSMSIGANRAAAVMFRAALHLFIKDRGNDKAKGERFLKPALKHMKESGDLHKSLWDWADHLNQIGNEGAHPEDYDEVTAQEATGLGRFVRQLIHLEYEMPAQLLRDQGLLQDDDQSDVDDEGDGHNSPLNGGLDTTRI